VIFLAVLASVCFGQQVKVDLNITAHVDARDSDVAIATNARFRAVEVVQFPKTVVFKAVSAERNFQGDAEVDATRVVVSSSDFVGVSLAYFHSEKDVDNDSMPGNFTAAKVATFIRFMELIEFEESGQHQGYQPAEDKFVKNFTLSNALGWKPIVRTVKNATSPDGDSFEVHVLSLCTISPGLCIYVAFTGKVVQSTPYVIDPDSVKITVVPVYSFLVLNPKSRVCLRALAGYKGKVVQSFPADFEFATDASETYRAQVLYQNTSTSLLGGLSKKAVIATYQADYKDDQHNLDVTYKLANYWFTFDEGAVTNLTVAFAWDMAAHLRIDYEALRGNITDAAQRARFRERKAVSVAENQTRAIDVKVFPLLRTIDIKAAAVARTNMSTSVDAFRLGLSNFFQASMALLYYKAVAQADQNGNVEEFAKAAFAFAIRFYGLYEYVESGNNTGFQPSEDSVVNVYSFNRYWIWKPMHHERVTIGKTDVDVFTMETRDGIFRVRLVLAGHPLDVGTKQLDPQRFKFDVDFRSEVNGTVLYQFKDAASRMALATVVLAKGARKVRLPSGSGGANETGSLDLNDNAGAAEKGTFTWDTEVDGVDAFGKTAFFKVHHTYEDVFHDENVTLDAGYSLSRIFFSFDAINPMSISWDPEVGVDPGYGTQPTSSPSSDSASYSETAEPTNQSSQSSEESSSQTRAGTTGSKGSSPDQPEDSSAATIVQSVVLVALLLVSLL